VSNDRPVDKPACPFCGEADRVRLFSANGGQIITSQWYCETCNTYYEAIREDFDHA
jgi:hypothetical protein